MSQVMYHVAPRSARESILANGLRPAGDEDETMWGESNPEAVYLFGNHEDAHHWINHSNENGYDWAAPWDVWQVNTEGLQPEQDWMMMPGVRSYDSNMVYEPIPPNRLRLLTDEHIGAIRSRQPKYVQKWVEQTHGPDEFQGHVSDCINPKCQHHWTPEEQHSLAQYGQIKCPRCGLLQNMEGGVGGWEDRDHYIEGPYSRGNRPGGGTRSGLSLSEMGNLAQQIVKRSDLPGFQFKHEFTENNWPIDHIWTDQHGNDWGMEIKAAHHQAQPRFKLGDSYERNKKIQYCAENGLRQGLLGVRMNFATNKADIFHRPQFTDTWIGAPTMRHLGTVDFEDLNPFKDPNQIPELPQESDQGLPF